MFTDLEKFNFFFHAPVETDLQHVAQITMLTHSRHPD